MATYLVKTDQGEFEVETEDPAQDSPDFMEPGSEKSFAEQAVSAISPTAPPKTGLGESLWQGTKEMFAPSMDSIKRLLNPNAGQFGPSRVLEQAGQQVGRAVRGAAQNTAEQIVTSKFGQQNPNTSAAIGAGYSTLADVTSDSLTPSAFQQQLGAEGLSGVARPAMKALSNELKTISNKAASSGFGFNKSVLNKVRGGSERAAVAAGEMVDRGAMGAFSSPETMKARVEAIQSHAGDAMGEIRKGIDASGSMPLNAGNIASQIEGQITPKASGGIADKMKAAVQNIVDTVKGHGDGPVTFEQMAEIKKLVDPGKWGDAQMAALGEDAKKIFQYRQRASAIIGDAMDKAVEASVDAGKLSKYLEAKDVYGKSSEVLKAVSDKVDRVAGKRLLDLPSTIAGTGGLTYAAITGDPVIAAKVLIAIGAEKFIQTFGPQQLALATKAAAGALNSGARSGFLATLQASARRALNAETPKKEAPAPKKSFLKSLDFSPGQNTASALEQIPKALPPLSKDQELNSKAVAALLRKDYQGAKGLWQKALKLNKRNLEARRGLERLAQRDGLDDIDSYKPK